jgi:hypothetical protein
VPRHFDAGRVGEVGELLQMLIHVQAIGGAPLAGSANENGAFDPGGEVYGLSGHRGKLFRFSAPAGVAHFEQGFKFGKLIEVLATSRSPLGRHQRIE